MLLHIYDTFHFTVTQVEIKFDWRSKRPHPTSLLCTSYQLLWYKSIHRIMRMQQGQQTTNYQIKNSNHIIVLSKSCGRRIKGVLGAQISLACKVVQCWCYQNIKTKHSSHFIIKNENCSMRWNILKEAILTV